MSRTVLDITEFAVPAVRAELKKDHPGETNAQWATEVVSDICGKPTTSDNLVDYLGYVIDSAGQMVAGYELVGPDGSVRKKQLASKLRSSLFNAKCREHEAEITLAHENSNPTWEELKRDFPELVKTVTRDGKDYEIPVVCMRAMSEFMQSKQKKTAGQFGRSVVVNRVSPAVSSASEANTIGPGSMNPEAVKEIGKRFDMDEHKPAPRKPKPAARNPATSGNARSGGARKKTSSKEEENEEKKHTEPEDPDVVVLETVDNHSAEMEASLKRAESAAKAAATRKMRAEKRKREEEEEKERKRSESHVIPDPTIRKYAVPMTSESQKRVKDDQSLDASSVHPVSRSPAIPAPAGGYYVCSPLVHALEDYRKSVDKEVLAKFIAFANTENVVKALAMYPSAIEAAIGEDTNLVLDCIMSFLAVAVRPGTTEQPYFWRRGAPAESDRSFPVPATPIFKYLYKEVFEKAITPSAVHNSVYASDRLDLWPVKTTGQLKARIEEEFQGEVFSKFRKRLQGIIMEVNHALFFPDVPEDDVPMDDLF